MAERICCKAGGTPAAAPTRTLPPDLLDAGARRLGVLALLTAVLTVGLGIVLRHVGMALAAPAGSRDLWMVATAAGTVTSAAIAILCLRKSFSAAALLDVGLVYEVAQAFCLSVLFHGAPYTTAVHRGWTTVAVWILVFPLVVPATRGKTLLATICAAAMDPAGLAVTVLAGNPAPRGLALVPIFLPTAVAAVVGLVLSRILYMLGAQVNAAREMGSYRMLNLLGRGGMGEVWLAEHRMLARTSAIKLITPDRQWGAGRDLLKRFEREARATAALRSPHTVQLYDFGTNEEGTFYYVMELLDGYDLESLVNNFGAIPPERAVSLLLQVCHSLAEAHARGLIHRDIKPANIYTCRYGLDYDFIKVLDFGLVKSGALRLENDGLSRPGIIAGTPSYMAPEMASGDDDVDARADIYSLGCVAYWLVTGSPVFDSPKVMAVLLDQVSTAPVPPSQRATQPIPPALEEVILACLAKNPDWRPATAGELARRLAETGLASQWTPERSEAWWKEKAFQPISSRPRREPEPPIVEQSANVARFERRMR